MRNKFRHCYSVFVENKMQDIMGDCRNCYNKGVEHALKKNPQSKQKVIDAASLLFFQNGFHGTSVRDIADSAEVNVSLISYYFKGKQGLLEYAVTKYYEAYFEEIDEKVLANESLSKHEQLKQLVAVIIEYKQSHLQLSCTIHREMSLDSVFVREMLVTYLAKESHYLSQLLFPLLIDQSTEEKQLLLMQLKGMLMTPYLLHNEWKYQVVGYHSHQLFVKRYVKKIHEWLDFVAH